MKQFTTGGYTNWPALKKYLASRGVKRRYMEVMSTIAQACYLGVGEDVSECLVRWRKIYPSWFTR